MAKNWWRTVLSSIVRINILSCTRKKVLASYQEVTSGLSRLTKVGVDEINSATVPCYRDVKEHAIASRAIPLHNAPS
jgi:hypothetical protein